MYDINEDDEDSDQCSDYDGSSVDSDDNIISDDEDYGQTDNNNKKKTYTIKTSK